MERYFGRSIDSLADIFTFVDEFLTSEGLPSSNSFSMDLILEELFTNMVKYSSDGNRDIRVSIDRGKNQLVLSLTDFDVEPFDITQAPEVDTEQPLSERTPGGLGIHFVRRMTDELTYEYRDRNSTITLIKPVEG